MNSRKKNEAFAISEKDIQSIVRQVLKEMSKQSHYKYYNHNPKGVVTGDCVIRSIGTALNKPWDNILKDLTKYSLKHKYYIGCVELYEIYLSDAGWTKHNAPHKRNGKPYKLIEWLSRFNGEAIVSIDDDHLAYVKEGVLYDTWDCTQHILGEYWTKGRCCK